MKSAFRSVRITGSRSERFAIAAVNGRVKGDALARLIVLHVHADTPDSAGL